MIEMNSNIVQQTLDSLKAKCGDLDMQRAEKSLNQLAALWTEEDGPQDEFISFCVNNYAENDQKRENLFKSLSDKFELITGHFHKINVGLKEPLHIDRKSTRLNSSH